MLQLTEKMRPTCLSKLCGQDHVVEVFQTAAKNDELDNYRVILLVGPRGCGKTSTARILAKLHNCLDTDWVKTYGEPCGKCENCKNIELHAGTAGGDIWELDGGAAGKMEVIQELLRSSDYSPTGKFKKRVFILDEAHKLSDGAKSALLKTMEEPPPHVVFILATTEGTKVPVPIQSRCQIFQYRLATSSVIADYLEGVLIANGYTGDRKALLKIGELSTGSFRDSLQILTKIFTMGSNHVSEESVAASLGLPDTNTILGIINTILDQDPKTMLDKLRDALKAGVRPEYLISEVCSRLGNSALSKVATASTPNPMVKGWPIPEILELSIYIKETATRYVGTDFGGLGASIALLMACYKRKLT